MGRKCWESIPASRRPLANRLNVVLTRTLPATNSTNDVIYCSSLEDALEEIAKRTDIENVWNIGGTSVYKEALSKNLVDFIALTRIHSKYDCDVYFSDDALKSFQLKESIEATETDTKLGIGILLTFQSYERL